MSVQYPEIPVLVGPADYTLELRNGKYFLWSADKAYDHERNTSLKTAVEAALTNRAAVGAKIKVGSGLFVQDGQIDIPNTEDHLSWLFEGNGLGLTRFTSDGGLTNDVFLECLRTAWGSPAKRTYVGTDKITFEPYGDEDGIINAPYCLPQIGAISIDGDLEDSPQNRNLYYGGAGGPNAPSRIELYHSRHTAPSDYGEMYLWLDNLTLDSFSISRHGSLVAGLLRFAGEYHHIDRGTFYISPGCTITSLIYGAGARVSIDKLTVNDGAATVDVFRTEADGFTECNVLFMPAATGLYYDATSEYLTRIRALYNWAAGPIQTFESRQPMTLMLVSSNTSSIAHATPGAPGGGLTEWTSNQRITLDLTRYKWAKMIGRISDASAGGLGKVAIYNRTNTRVLCEQELALGDNRIDSAITDISDETGSKELGLYDYSGDDSSLSYYNISLVLWP